MLEKIGLPPKPSLRGNNWVVDSSNCQCCSSQFTFINRKHHCRRCGGLFCNSCTQQRMILRGQGDSPVRICEPCKKLEEAARFELRYGQKGKAGRGSSRLPSKDEDELLNQILGSEGKESSSSGGGLTTDVLSRTNRRTSSESCSNGEEDCIQDQEQNKPITQFGNVASEVGSVSPEELRQQAQDEKKKYRTLKAGGKSEEALRAFKRGKELERQAAALDIQLRKNRKKGLSASNVGEIEKDADNSKGSSRKPKLSAKRNKEKDDFTAELRELGLSDVDLHEGEKRPATMTLEDELSSLLREVSKKPNTEERTPGTDKSLVIAHKKRALELKREGKLAEAKEELKRAKLLEKQIEEEELLGEAEDSDEEFSSLMRSLDVDRHDDFSPNSNFDFDNLMGVADELGTDSNFEVTDEDMNDPEIATALQSLGWIEDDSSEVSNNLFLPTDREALLSEVQALKREALSQKRAGNTAEAMALLKKAKVLEKDIDSYGSQHADLSTPSYAMAHKDTESISVDEPLNFHKEEMANAKDTKISDPKAGHKSKLMIQKELLALKKKALTLRREGKLDEAEEELRKGKVLEQQLEEINNAGMVMQPTHKLIHNSDMAIDDGNAGEVTDEDMHDPNFLSLLKNLGWKDDGSENVQSVSSRKKESTFAHIIDSSVTEAAYSESNLDHKVARKSKLMIQRELIALKKKALTLRREGKLDEAEEELRKGKVLEQQLEEVDNAPTVMHPNLKTRQNSDILAIDVGDEGKVTDQNMNDPTHLSLLKNLGWNKEENENIASGSLGEQANTPARVTVSSVTEALVNTKPGASRKSKGEIQRELLGLKRKSLALRRQGEAEEAEEVLKMARQLETQLEELETLSLKAPPETKEPKESTVLESAHGMLSVPSLLNAQKSPADECGEKGKSIPEKPDELVQADVKPFVPKSDSAQVINAPNDPGNIHQDILAHKKKAVMLKREGKLTEAKEELRQAKLLEKLLEEEKSQSTSSRTYVLAGDNPSVGKKEENPSSGSQPLSGRDRFKLQQESLSHKRQALKLRREGRTEEADAEFELAKSLEAQLEESASHDLTKPTDFATGPLDDVSVEDFLDPQLLSALKAIGLEDASARSQSTERPHLKKSVSATVNPGEVRMKLEEQIKAEKLKALNLKRSGKQAEALEALRRAKLYEKELNALALQ